MVTVPVEIEVEETEETFVEGGEDLTTLPELTRDDNIVYPEEFIIKDYCGAFEGYTMSDFQTCVTYAQTEIFVSYLSLFFGLLVGFIIAKAVSDGWG